MCRRNCLTARLQFPVLQKNICFINEKISAAGYWCSNATIFNGLRHEILAGPGQVAMSTKLSRTIRVGTPRHSALVDITDTVAGEIPTGFSGICHLFCLHTTAGLTVNENADPDVGRDILGELERIVPWQNPSFQHIEGNSAAHMKSSLVGVDLSIPVSEGRLGLGTWQAIYFCEFDGPRSRRVAMTLVPVP